MSCLKIIRFLRKEISVEYSSIEQFASQLHLAGAFEKAFKQGKEALRQHENEIVAQHQLQA